METPNRQAILGGILVLFGLLFFLRAADVIEADNILLSPRMYPLYAALAFYIGKQNKIAVVCLGLSVIAWFDKIYYYLSSYFKFIWPLALVVLGVLLITGVVNFKKLKDKKEEDSEDEGNGGSFSL